MLTTDPQYFEVISDLNNNGKIDGGDRTFKSDGAKSDATDEQKEKATEYVFANDTLSNGAWDKDDTDSNKPQNHKDDDDVEELSLACAATWGAVWFEHPAIEKLSFYRTKECKQTPDDKLTFPFALSDQESGKLPEKIYVRLDGADFTEEAEGDLVMKFGKVDKTETWAEDKLKFTAVKHIGDSKYFRAARDYIWENNTKFFVNEKKYGTTTVFRLVVMRKDAAVMYTVDTYDHANDTGRLLGIDQVVSNYAADVVINGNQCYSSHGNIALVTIYRMTDRCDGRLVVGRQVLRPPSEDNHHDLGGEQYGRYIGHWLSPNHFVFGAGRVPENAGNATPDTAMGGLSTNYSLPVRQSAENQIIGYVPADMAGEELVFAATNMVGAGGKALEFSQDAALSGVPPLPGGDSDDLKLLHLDGSSSVGLSYTNPAGQPNTAIKGGKHAPGATSYYINTYLLFECNTPRNP